MTEKNYWHYIINNNNTARYVLGKHGEKPLVCIGVNPSTATPEKLDNTICRVKNITKDKGFNGWMMFNLYPQRATNPNDLDDKPNKQWQHFNLHFIQHFLLEYPNATIWAAWGTSIMKRKYLYECLRNIKKAVNRKYQWITIGKCSIAGHPHHPLYLPKTAMIKHFDVAAYWMEN